MAELEEKKPRGDRRVRRLLAIVAVIALAWALEWTASVMLPVAFALFLIAVFWPVYALCTKWLPDGVAAVVTLVVLLAVVGAIGAGLGYSAQVVASRSDQYGQRLDELTQAGRTWAEHQGLPVPAEAGSASGSLRTQALSVSRRVFDVLGASVLVLAFFVLGLLEVRDYEKRMVKSLPATHEKWKQVAKRVAKDFQRYVVVRTVIGLITGVGTFVGCLIIGLDFAFVWGLLNFLLNYIPTLGSIIGVIPPTLFALVQFDDPMMALLTLGVVGGLQLIMGNYVDPLLQGKYLSLSPFVVLFSVVFWGFIWGIAGAFIAVPLTLLVVLVCRQFDRTRWISDLLAEVPKDEDDSAHEQEAQIRADGRQASRS